MLEAVVAGIDLLCLPFGGAAPAYDDVFLVVTLGVVGQLLLVVQMVHCLVAMPLTSSLRQLEHACNLIVLVLRLDAPVFQPVVVWVG